MRSENQKEDKKTGNMFRNPIIIAIAALFVMVLLAQPLLAQKKGEDKGKGKNRIGLFIDEDGDGINDLAPDDDGDGIPNGIDPDYKGHSAESLYMYRYMYGQSIEAERNRFQNESHYGEPGQYGPHDSTGHGQGDGRGGHQGNNDSGNEGDGGGQGGQGGSGDHGGGNGKLAGGSASGSAGSGIDNQSLDKAAPAAEQGKTIERQASQQPIAVDQKDQKTESGKRSGNQNKKGGR